MIGIRASLTACLCFFERLCYIVWVFRGINTVSQSVNTDELKVIIYNFCSLGRSSFEHRYTLASASPSAHNKPSDMFLPVQLMAFTHQ